MLFANVLGLLRTQFARGRHKTHRFPFRCFFLGGGGALGRASHFQWLNRSSACCGKLNSTLCGSIIRTCERESEGERGWKRLRGQSQRRSLPFGHVQEECVRVFSFFFCEGAVASLSFCRVRVRTRGRIPWTHSIGLSKRAPTCRARDPPKHTQAVERRRDGARGG